MVALATASEARDLLMQREENQGGSEALVSTVDEASGSGSTEMSAIIEAGMLNAQRSQAV